MKKFGKVLKISVAFASTLVVCTLCCSSVSIGQTGKCWTAGTTPCSTWGVTGATCAATRCVPAGLLGTLTCPAGSTENFRQFPATQTVRSCQSARTGKLTCSTVGGATTWCIGSRPCSSPGGAGVCGLVPGTLPSAPRFCITAVGGAVTNVSGLAAATLGTRNCTSGS